MSIDYTELDAAILERLRGGGDTATGITNALQVMAEPMAKRDWKGRPETFRVIDRRLQALRKRGVIHPTRNGTTSVWTVTEAHARSAR